MRRLLKLGVHEKDLRNTGKVPSPNAGLHKKMMYGNLEGASLKGECMCTGHDTTFKWGIAVWEGPIAYLILVQFL